MGLSGRLLDSQLLGSDILDFFYQVAMNDTSAFLGGFPYQTELFELLKKLATNYSIGLTKV